MQLKFLLSRAAPYRFRILLVSLLSILNSLAILAVPWLAGQLIGGIFQGASLQGAGYQDMGGQFTAIIGLLVLVLIAITVLRVTATFVSAEFVRLDAHEIQRLNDATAANARSPQSADNSDRVVVERVAYVVPRVGARLPWRSDCLIQAMAAQRWLRSKGIATMIVIGVEKPAESDFAAHAWLKYGKLVVTGGTVEKFTVLLQGGEEL